MDGPQQLMENSELFILGTGIDSFGLLAFTNSGVGLNPTSLGDSSFAYTLSSLGSLPLTLAGTVNTMAKEQRDIGASGPDLTTHNSTLDSLQRTTDGNFLQTSESVRSDINKQAFDEKGLSPLNILVSSTYNDTGQPSPAASSQCGIPVLQFRSAGNGGDTMLSAINYSDNEMLNDTSAFDINNGATAGLTHLDDNFLSGLGNPASSLRMPESHGSNAFDLFDNSVSDPLSPFGDAGLAIDTGSLPVMDTEKNSGLSYLLA